MTQLETSRTVVRHFRQVLLCPLQLMPIHEGSQVQNHWAALEGVEPWHELLDKFGGGGSFQERHYSEFVTFLPHVQRFLYGEGRSSRTPQEYRASPLRVFRRSDVTAVRITLNEGDAALEFLVSHVDLYFFFDIDLVLLSLEICADDLPLEQVQDVLYRFGRAYPAGWEESGQGVHCPFRSEWLGASGQVLATSDFERREAYLAFARQHRAPHIGAHWAFLLKPLMLDYEDQPGVIRYRQLEYHRLPTMAYVAVDRPQELTRAELVRLGLITAPGKPDALPFSSRYLADFERRYCYDRHWLSETGSPSRVMCCGQALVVVGEAGSSRFTDLERGGLARFRHQYFLLFLIAHFQKAALLMFSDRLVEALNKLEVHNANSVRRFKRTIRQNFEIFLRFTHRYWFHEVSNEAQCRALFGLCMTHLESQHLYTEVKDEIADMSQYLDSDSLRRQANTVVRLTVVTTFGLIGTLTTGFLGMNLLAAADSPFLQKMLYFVLSLIPITWVTLYSIVKSKRLSEFLEVLSDERVSAGGKLAAMVDVWRDKRG